MGFVKDRWLATRDGEKVPTTRYGKGLRWQVWVTAEGKQRCGGSFRTKAMAERKLLDLESQAALGQWVNPNDQTTVAHVVRRYAANRHHRRRSAERVEGLIVHHVEAVPLGSRRAVAVKPSEVQSWVVDRSRVLAPSTMRLLVGLVRAAFRDAVLDRVVAVSPCERISMPSQDPTKVVPLTVDQVRALADAIGSRYRAMVVVQAGLGLRVSELLALRVQDVDFLKRTVRIDEQIERETRRRVAPKTASSRRTLPLPDFVSLEVAGHIQRHPPAADGLLFHTRDDRPLHYGVYRDTFKAAVEAAGLPAGSGTHDLRHHFASIMLAHGQSIVAVAELLGHSNATMVSEVYGHLVPGGEDVARRAIEGAWVAEIDVAAQNARGPSTAP